LRQPAWHREAKTVATGGGSGWGENTLKGPAIQNGRAVLITRYVVEGCWGSEKPTEIIWKSPSTSALCGNELWGGGEFVLGGSLKYVREKKLRRPDLPIMGIRIMKI